MKANETKVEDFLSSNKTQFVIPVYQRNYDWSVGQCKQLLDDILEVGTDKKMNAHFIGSLVYVHGKRTVNYILPITQGLA